MYTLYVIAQPRVFCKHTQTKFVMECETYDVSIKTYMYMYTQLMKLTTGKSFLQYDDLLYACHVIME